MPGSASPPRGRFAPSPTGPLHFGSLVAALGSFLEARQQGGEWWVRIEDVDTQRARTGAAEAILRALDRYHLHWDGSVLYQSRRTDAYQTALERLFDAGLAYPCTCSRRELANHPRARDGSPVYPGRCRAGLGHADRPFAIRLRVTDTPLIFRDAVQGDYRQRLADDVGDFTIRRADGLFAYQLAVVVDDAAQGVTQVVRGRDLLDSTPRQIYLQQVLGLPTPRYAHLPVATDRRGRKLSKQTGATPLDPLDPSPLLWAALDFLGQSPPPALRREPPATILAWALEHWRLATVPTTPSRRCLDAAVARHAPSGHQESDRRAIDKAEDVV
ncbi:MAG TPA: tRNA glutamyl-Q(34) synthetase GluQRS [Candidatus Competibacter sp.]|mgnify:FL=1|nr:tRNA glutamyl-Q(34) synthetase GluQRS [Candidatus Competibacteraceae bacterium]HRC73720.1 tRNA glutamyl-Q(34) synthetase GluQRS [Candidatus Competibacter sp.]